MEVKLFASQWTYLLPVTQVADYSLFMGVTRTLFMCKIIENFQETKNSFLRMAHCPVVSRFTCFFLEVFELTEEMLAESTFIYTQSRILVELTAT